MACPAKWREAAVRHYVESEFRHVGARVYRAYVHPPPPGAPPCTAAVADVLLDFSMGRARIGEAVKAMLAAPPLPVPVDDFTNGAVMICFHPAVGLESTSSSAHV
jgi:hypothetical protein